MTNMTYFSGVLRNERYREVCDLIDEHFGGALMRVHARLNEQDRREFEAEISLLFVEMTDSAEKGDLLERFIPAVASVITAWDLSQDVVEVPTWAERLALALTVADMTQEPRPVLDLRDSAADPFAAATW